MKKVKLQGSKTHISALRNYRDGFSVSMWSGFGRSFEHSRGLFSWGVTSACVAGDRGAPGRRCRTTRTSSSREVRRCAGLEKQPEVQRVIFFPIPRTYFCDRPQMARLGLSTKKFPTTLFCGVIRIAPDKDLWRTLYRLSYSATAKRVILIHQMPSLHPNCQLVTYLMGQI